MSAPSGLYLGFDYGTRQIGVAVGQAVTGQARELLTLKAQNGVPDWQQIQRLLDEWRPTALVVGLPLNMDGTPSEMSERAERFARRLHGRYGLPVHTHDERLTTYAAKGERLQGGQRADGQLPWGECSPCEKVSHHHDGAAEERGPWQHEAMVGAQQQAHEMRCHEPDESDGAGGRHARGRQQ